MDIVLITLTAISLSLAAGMGIVLLRTLREERERSEARVAILSAAAAARRLPPVPGQPAPPGTSRLAAEKSRLAPARARLANDRMVADLFAVPEEPSTWPRRLGAAAALAALLAAAGFAFLGTGSTPPLAPPADVAPLELLALDHLPEAGAFTVSGTVRNPGSGDTMSDVVVTASLFGADGTPVGSGRAALDYRRLAPGDASPFVVKVPVHAPVTRYRIGFRTAGGTVVSHVDRRSDQPSVRVVHAGSSPWTR